jgi:hypothetical protein
MRAIALSGARVASTDYDTGVHLVLEVRRSAADRLRNALIEATRGAAVVAADPQPGNGGRDSAR